MPDLGFLFNANGPAYLADQARKADAASNDHTNMQTSLMGAQIPGIQAQGRSLSTQADYDQQMLGSKVAVGQSNNSTQINNNNFATLQQTGEKLGISASILDQTPSAARPAVFQQLRQKMGLDSPELNQLSQVPPDALPSVLRHINQGITQSNPGYQKQMDLEHGQQEGLNKRNDSTNAMHLGVAGINSDRNVQTANISAQARIEAAQEQSRRAIQSANTKLNAALSMLTPDKRFVMLNQIAPEDRTPEQQGEFQRLSTMMLAQRAAGANGLAPQVMNGESPTTPQQNATNMATSITGGGNTTQPPVDAIVKDAATNAWGSYEPNKYDYRVINGQLQRKPK